jgi:hypothetical protein
MAPNQKRNVLNLQTFAEEDLQLVVPKQYLPLTSLPLSDALSKNDAVEVKTSIKSSSDDYWQWDASVKTTTPTTEKKKDLFSASFFEASLLKESQRMANRREGVTIIRAAKHEEHPEDYWDAPQSTTRNEANAAMSDNTGYWDWPKDSKAAQIALILKEELARNLVSAERMEEHLLENARTQTHGFEQTKAENDSYWTWDSPTTVYADPGTVDESYWECSQEEETPVSLLAAILEYEANRELFTVDHMIQAEAKASGQRLAPEKQVVNAPNKVGSDAYWAWPVGEDNYWDWNTPAQKGYWDW